MKWTIKRISDGKYLYTGFVFTDERAFARRFGSEKQAKAFLRTTDHERDNFIIEELSDEKADELKRKLNELTELIQYNF